MHNAMNLLSRMSAEVNAITQQDVFKFPEPLHKGKQELHLPPYFSRPKH